MSFLSGIPPSEVFAFDRGTSVRPDQRGRDRRHKGRLRLGECLEVQLYREARYSTSLVLTVPWPHAFPCHAVPWWVRILACHVRAKLAMTDSVNHYTKWTKVNGLIALAAGGLRSPDIRVSVMPKA